MKKLGDVASEAVSYLVGVSLGASLGGFLRWSIGAQAEELVGPLTRIDFRTVGAILGAMLLCGLIVRQLWLDRDDDRTSDVKEEAGRDGETSRPSHLDQGVRA